MPSVEAVMELPPPNSNIHRLAEKISAMPAELIEQFIKDLPLHRVLELSLAPTAGPRLFWAVENSVVWRGLLRTQPVESDHDIPSPSSPGSRPPLELLQRLYTTANLLAWNTCHMEAINAMNAPVHDPLCLCARVAMPMRERLSGLQLTGRPMQALERNIFMDRLKANFVSAFQDCFMQCQSRRLYSLCVFLPKDEEWMTQPHVSQADTRTEIEPWANYLQQPAGELSVFELVEKLSLRPWTAEQAQDVSPRLLAAAESLRQAKSAELNRLADLHERYPTILKLAFAPQGCRGGSAHIRGALRRDAKQVLTGVLLPAFRKSKHLRQRERAGWYRFRYPHPALVPYDWCLRLFRCMTHKHAIPEDESDLVAGVYPSTLIPDLRRASDGFEFIHSNELPGELRRITPGSWQDICHMDYRVEDSKLRILPDGCGPSNIIPMGPHVLAELEWLESICRCVEWAEANASALGIDMQMFRHVQEAKGTEVSVTPKHDFKVLSSKEDYEEFIAHETPELLARQLRADSDQCDALNPTKLPSLLALYLPPAGSLRAKEISHYLLPNFDEDLQKLMYEDLTRKVQLHIRKAPELEQPSDRQQLVCDALETGKSPAAPSQNPKNTSWKESVDRFVASKPGLSSKKVPTCYICCMWIGRKPHPTFPAMCEPCGEFNLAGSSLSLPKSLNLSNKVALVTGARVNLGFHTALRLLRCGAKVIVTTRYPRDAAIRYRAEPDHEEWIERLSICGADFRSAKDAFALVNQVKELLTHESFSGRLDILINNAAQTLTDSVAKEEKAVQREKLLEFGGERSVPHNPLMITSHAYTARVRGVDPESRLLKPSTNEQTPRRESDEGSKELETHMSEMQLDTPAGPSSWVQSLSEIPYEDVISAHSVNTFVPLILVRELLPLLRGEPQQDGQASGYIVNVSSREGIFEATATSGAKNGHHVHTNMSKAGLNMITETEAAPAWRKHRVAMNTVDPGYMSAAPEYENAYDGERPIGWEDGAGRVLWPIAMAETGESGPIWGRFLKHYGAKRVDVRLGRG